MATHLAATDLPAEDAATDLPAEDAATDLPAEDNAPIERIQNQESSTQRSFENPENQEMKIKCPIEDNEKFKLEQERRDTETVRQRMVEEHREQKDDELENRYPSEIEIQEILLRREVERKKKRAERKFKLEQERRDTETVLQRMVEEHREQKDDELAQREELERQRKRMRARANAKQRQHRKDFDRETIRIARGRMHRRTEDEQLELERERKRKRGRANAKRNQRLKDFDKETIRKARERMLRQAEDVQRRNTRRADVDQSAEEDTNRPSRARRGMGSRFIKAVKKLFCCGCCCKVED